MEKFFSSYAFVFGEQMGPMNQPQVFCFVQTLTSRDSNGISFGSYVFHLLRGKTYVISYNAESRGSISSR